MSKLTTKQCRGLADQRPEWLACHQPEWMAENHEDWMVIHRREWVYIHFPSILAARKLLDRANQDYQ